MRFFMLKNQRVKAETPQKGRTEILNGKRCTCTLTDN